MNENNNTLPIGTVLESGTNKYTIISVLGAGGFGITYKATTTIRFGNLNTIATVAIKEHFLSADCERTADRTISYSAPARERVENSRKSFIAEARRIRDFSGKHQNIVSVNETFEANNTAYYVMEFLEGESLRDYVKRSGPLTEQKALELMTPIISAVAFLHNNKTTHLDIKPANIMLTQDAEGKLRPVLIDFGLSKHFDEEGNSTSSIAALGLSRGYSPIEQQLSFSRFCPQSDVYSLGATILFCLTGTTPPPAENLGSQILEESIPGGISSKLRNVIKKAMSLLSADRFTSAASMLEVLHEDGNSHTADSVMAPDMREDTQLFDNDSTAKDDSEFEVSSDDEKTEYNQEYYGNGDNDDEWEEEAAARKKRLLTIGGIAVALLAVFIIFFYTRTRTTSDENADLQSDSIAVVDSMNVNDIPIAEPTLQPSKTLPNLTGHSMSSQQEDAKKRKVEEPKDNKRSEVKEKKQTKESNPVNAESMDAALVTSIPDNEKTQPSRREEVIAEPAVEDEPLSISQVEVKPEFPGGEVAMYQWLGNNIVYPTAAVEEGVQGRVVVEFVIDKDGSISNVRVVRPRHPALDKEALRVIKAMPNWKPARNNAQPVKVTYTLPVTFKLS